MTTTCGVQVGPSHLAEQVCGAQLRVHFCYCMCACIYIRPMHAYVDVHVYVLLCLHMQAILQTLFVQVFRNARQPFSRRMILILGSGNTGSL